jgi:hypothetical protein
MGVPAITLLDDKKLLFEPVERLIQKSGKCQPFFCF